MSEIVTPKVTPGGSVIELVAAGEFGRRHVPAPEPGRGEAVIAMRALGLCGTDLHLYGGRGDSYPHVVGHDGAAVVHAVGEGVENVVVGQRVTVDPVTRCGVCADCERGAVQLCRYGGYLGMIGPGLLAEYVCLPAVQLVGLPDAVSDLAATVLEPVAVAVHTLRRTAAMLPGPVPCAVVGGGPLGILLAQVLNHRGYDSHIFEPQAGRRELAAGLGLRAHEPVAVDIGAGPRLVVETSAAAAGVALADELASPGSVVAVVGRAPSSIAPPSVLLKELTLVGVKGGPGCYAESVSLVAEGAVDPAAVITHEFGWGAAAEAFRVTSQCPDVVVRSVLHGEW
ncbi:alcohol dehydrogenase catalytic domain-containing protein [Nocardia sp. R6R-6]|uniref:alcohol dehydrogenase catalytic domain-containing protein n=1 Tax=Nocardia sp. R6R-6 TaxID=3459303 RepID=UPI00403D5C51